MNETVETRILGTSQAEIAEAGQRLADGELVAFPTETVYGLGADATNDLAVAGIFAAKGRPSFNPLIAHVADLRAAETLCDFNEDALRLAATFWPGALTLVLPLKPNTRVSKLVTAGGAHLALRVPSSPIATALLQAAKTPIAAPSANPSGKISPTTAAHVLNGLSGRIDAVIDAGPCPVGLESTIVGFDEGPVLLRAGGIPAEAIEACLGTKLRTHTEKGMPTAPGQLASHYAPKSRVRLNATKPEAEEFHIGFGPIDGDISLSRNGDLQEAAAHLFEALHIADATGRAICVAPVPNTGLGRAINDRLTRAAAPRN
ncbi:L-threonylcarbamoyladenylate synthase [Boseongicola aestuarii]|uniref:Threonylcarbamoyl-AMP synthase n=1 Tax=Boseongicola aestuarii TaxID=1470561 RepID=A0A238J2V5_9RHOB|nr:L-threonylcarbamoyladenylate synthase [Boseongicola aestuarii]SMX24663.1 Threonylcarbamoyl-AMP synthase [Boseongicola aestuarii]